MDEREKELLERIASQIDEMDEVTKVEKPQGVFGSIASAIALAVGSLTGPTQLFGFLGILALVAFLVMKLGRFW